MLSPIAEDWEAEKDREGDYYVAVCPEIHMVADAHVASNGWWIGDTRAGYDDALYDARNHEHIDAAVVVCAPDGRWSAVQWPSPDAFAPAVMAMASPTIW